MADLLSTSVTGMLAFQRGLDVTSHNIANASTPGYSRQVAEFSTMPGQASGNGFVGSGVQVTTIRRVYDQLLGLQLQNATTSRARLDMLDSLAAQVDGLLSSPDTGLSPAMQRFFESVQDVANDPASLSARQAMLGEADGFVQRLQGIDTRLNDMESEVNGRLREAVADVNRLAQSIAEANDQIALAQGRTGQPPNDLLDRRDLLIRELAAQVAVTTVPQDDGAINVFFGSGQTLVIGAAARSLAVRGNEFDPTRIEIAYRSGGVNTPLDTGLTGGAVGGLLEFRASLLDPARQMLGETAQALAAEFNRQHASGMDLRGALGGDFFSLAAPTVLPSSNNAGTGTVAVSLTDVGALTGANYVLSYDGANYSLRDADSGQNVVMTGTGTALDPLVANGLSIVVGGAPAAGDEVKILPSRDAPAGLGVAITDVQAIAMAAPTRTSKDTANVGDATISPSVVADAADPNLLTSSVIEFTGPNTYSVNGAGAFAYVSGDPIVINGSEFTITGAPQAGDRFTIEANIGGSGDNRNGLLLADIQTRGILVGGTIGVGENYGRLIADVGGTSSQIQASLSAQDVIVQNLEDTMAAKSGVNLDEEAAQLIRFQQAYQAVAQVVAITSTLFDTLIGAVRR